MLRLGPLEGRALLRKWGRRVEKKREPGREREEGREGKEWMEVGGKTQRGRDESGQKQKRPG